MTDIKFINLLKTRKISQQDLANTLVNILINKNIKIATAESCTGGLISKKIVDIPGSSKIFDFGACTYGNNMKSKVLNVKESTLKNHGAVSGQTACEMAKGVRLLSSSDIGVSTTGIAGPGGGTKEKPVGLIYIGISTAKNTFAVKTNINSSLSRSEIRNISGDMALFYAINTANKF